MKEASLRQRQRALREREIALATARLLGIADCRSLTMEQVAAALNTSKSSLYRLFSRESLLRRALEIAVRDALADARVAAQKVSPKDRLRAAARVLVARWLALAAPPTHGVPAPCCLKEVVCPYTDWTDVNSLLAELAPAGSRGRRGRRGGEMDVARAIRALAAVRMHQLRAARRKPTRADVDAILRYLVPDLGAGRSNRAPGA